MHEIETPCERASNQDEKRGPYKDLSEVKFEEKVFYLVPCYYSTVIQNILGLALLGSSLSQSYTHFPHQGTNIIPPIR